MAATELTTRAAAVYLSRALYMRFTQLELDYYAQRGLLKPINVDGAKGVQRHWPVDDLNALIPMIKKGEVEKPSGAANGHWQRFRRKRTQAQGEEAAPWEEKFGKDIVAIRDNTSVAVEAAAPAPTASTLTFTVAGERERVIESVRKHVDSTQEIKVTVEVL